MTSSLKRLFRQDNDTDKKLEAATEDKCDVTKECRRQLYAESTYFKLSEDVRNDPIRSIKLQLQFIVEKHFYKGSCFFKEAENFVVQPEQLQNPTRLYYLENLQDPMVGNQLWLDITGV